MDEKPDDDVARETAQTILLCPNEEDLTNLARCYLDALDRAESLEKENALLRSVNDEWEGVSIDRVGSHVMEKRDEWRSRAERAEAECHRLALLVEKWECESHPWEGASGDPVCFPEKVRSLIDALFAERDDARAKLAAIGKAVRSYQRSTISPHSALGDIHEILTAKEVDDG